VAKRPIFIPCSGEVFVLERYVNFDWAPGMSLSQRRKSIADLHAKAERAIGVKRPLEVSSKSPEGIGVRLSSFNLKFQTQKGIHLTVETAFQGSKKFERGGPYRDLFFMEPKDAKRDERLYLSGPIIGFNFFRQEWPLEPKTAFYDWLYINALIKNSELAFDVLEFDSFTDIEFNPDRSINCQARSIALYCSLHARGMLSDWLESPEKFRDLHRRFVPDPAKIIAGPAMI